ncbi:type IV pilin [Haloarchaeobius sp. DFWS5]|uniref:type IV pilin n=1 Tax=Haloarchaeobius sp. DFWS5 TaxID=3446114 RepID=UPI003EBFAB38
MNWGSRTGESRGISSVISTVLMVAVVLIMAVSVGVFVFDIDDALKEPSPSAVFEFEYTDATSDTLNVSHQGGDTVDGDNVYVVVTGATVNGGTSADGRYRWTDPPLNGDEDITASSTAVGNPGYNLDLSSASVVLVYDDPDTDESYVLDSWEGPDR